MSEKPTETAGGEAVAAPAWRIRPGWFGAGLFVAQVIMWYVGGWFIADSDLPDSISWIAVGLPILISWVGWRLVNNSWGWRLHTDGRDVRKIRGCRRIGVSFAIVFIFADTLVFSALRHVDMGVKKEKIEAQVNLDMESLLAAIGQYANEHAGGYPKTLAELEADRSIKSAGVLSEKTIANIDQYEYCGSGLTNASTNGIIVIADKIALPDGTHVLIGNDSQKHWVGPVGFVKIQPLLEKHVPVSEW